MTVRPASLARRRTSSDSAQVTDAAITLDALQPLQVHADFAAQVAFNDVFAILDRVNNLRELLLGQILGADARIDICASEDLVRVGGTDAINVAQGDFDALVGRDFYSNDAGHKKMDWWINGLVDC